MIKFPLTELLDEQACYEWLMKVLHPQGLHCQRDTHYHQDKHRIIANAHPSSNTSVENVAKYLTYLQGQTYEEATTTVVRSC